MDLSQLQQKQNIRHTSTAYSKKEIKHLQDNLYLEARRRLHWILLAKMQKHKKKWVADGNQVMQIRRMLAYFCGIEGQIDIVHNGQHIYHPADLDLDKGIYLYGETGIGKTTLMEAFAELTQQFQQKKRTFIMSRMREVTRLVRDEGNKEALSILHTRRRCLDDIGWQDDIVDFGNRINITEEVIHQRDINHTRSPQKYITHATSMIPLSAWIGENSELTNPAMKNRFKRLFQPVALFGSNKTT